MLSMWSGLKFCCLVNPLSDDILTLSKLKAFADDKLNVAQNIEVVFHRIENIVGKEENACYQHFLLFPQCFQRAFSSGRQKSSLYGKGLTVKEFLGNASFRPSPIIFFILSRIESKTGQTIWFSSSLFTPHFLA